jgi:hypothetical protein
MTVVPTTTNSADMTWADPKDPTGIHRGSLNYKALGNDFADEDISVTLTADGRLSGINATSAGEADTFAKNLVIVGAAVAALTGGKPKPYVAKPEDKACEVIDAAAAVGQGDPSKVAPTITFTYSIAFTYDFGADQKTPGLVVDPVLSPAYPAPSPAATNIKLLADPAVTTLVSGLNTAMPGKFDPQLIVVTTPATLKYLENVQTPDKAPDPYIELTKVAVVALRVNAYVGDLSTAQQVWGTTVPVPTRTSYDLPIPKPAIAGKTAFSVALSDYGSVTTLHYGTNTPVGDVSDAAGAIAKAFQPKSAEDRSNDYKGQADLIAQQQRLIACEVDPTTCK